MSNQTRRNFVKNVSLGAATLGLTSFTSQKNLSTSEATRNSREVWIATLALDSITGTDIREVTKAALNQMENAVPFVPDIYCLPETFHVSGIKNPSLEITSEDGSGKIIGPFQEFAKKHQCYVICPVFTKEKGRYFNAAVVIDRQGKKIGEYRKVNLPTGEMEKGLTPGLPDVPVFQTDFGIIGIQICFDMNWFEGWDQLRKKGAEIVFWPSAFGGGKRVNTKAWENQYYVVSSTLKGTTKICDTLGEDLALSGIYSKWGVCAKVNLETVFLHTWPYNSSFPDIQKKYGRKVSIKTLHDEEFSVIESLSPEVKVSDIMKEFNLKSYREHLKLADDMKDKRGFRSY